MQLSLPFGADEALPRIRARLLAIHGAQRDALRLDPTSQFVGAMLSSRPLDAVSRRAFRRLFAMVGQWNVLPDMDAGALTAVIHDVTFADRKADQLVRASRIVRMLRGRFDFAFLADWSVEASLDWLVRLPGAGPKVAAATLNFSTLCKRAIVVDTHVLRIAVRLGLVPVNADITAGFCGLMRLVPDLWDADDLYELHWLLKRHGQTRCHLQQPVCEGCPLAEFCIMRSGTPTEH